jgi:hypothetical protein
MARSRIAHPRRRRVPAYAAVATALALTVVGTPPAFAHPFVVPQEVEPRTPVELRFDVPVEQRDPAHPQPLVRVDVVVPDGFTYESASQTPERWTAVKGPAGLSLTGEGVQGKLAFSIKGTFAERGVFLFPVTTHTADGESVLWDAELTQYALSHTVDLHPAPTVWVGMPRVIPEGGPGGDRSWLPPVVAAAVVGALAAGVVLRVRSRRAVR